MATLLADSPTAPAEQDLQAQAPGAPSGAPAQQAPQPAPERPCPRCGAALAGGQDWCLQCGSGAPGSLGSPSWRPAVAILAAIVVLLLVAAGAGYAALSKSAPAAHVLVATVATAAPVATPPPAAAAPATTAKPATPAPAKPKPTTSTPAASVNKPASTPSAKATKPKPSGTKTTSTSPESAAEGEPATPSPSGSSGKSRGEVQETEPGTPAILLDTNAASTYNPNNYLASYFGDPTLAIDGDSSTSWNATVNPATAPKMAAGLIIDLKSAQRIASLKLITSTPGIVVQVFGSESLTAPTTTTITDPSWVKLSKVEVVRKKHLRITLRESTKAFTFITVWLLRAPASSVGTPQRPGHVSINEVELFSA